MNAKQTSNFVPTIEKNARFYVRHIVGSPTTYVYDIAKKMIITLVANFPISQYPVLMTFEDFVRETAEIQKIAIDKTRGLN